MKMDLEMINKIITPHCFMWSENWNLLRTCLLLSNKNIGCFQDRNLEACICVIKYSPGSERSCWSALDNIWTWNSYRAGVLVPRRQRSHLKPQRVISMPCGSLLKVKGDAPTSCSCSGGKIVMALKLLLTVITNRSLFTLKCSLAGAG